MSQNNFLFYLYNLLRFTNFRLLFLGPWNASERTRQRAKNSLLFENRVSLENKFHFKCPITTLCYNGTVMLYNLCIEYEQGHIFSLNHSRRCLRFAMIFVHAQKLWEIRFQCSLWWSNYMLYNNVKNNQLHSKIGSSCRIGNRHWTILETSSIFEYVQYTHTHNVIVIFHLAIAEDTKCILVTTHSNRNTNATNEMARV